MTAELELDFAPAADGLLGLHNVARAKMRLPPYRADPRLTAAAQAHADDMARRRRLDHKGADGSQPWDRATRAGYHWRAVAENVAAGQTTTESVMKDAGVRNE